MHAFLFLNTSCFDAIVNDNLFISILDCLLLLYKNKIEIYMPILYPSTLPNSLISSSSLFVASIGFSIQMIVSSANKSSFTSYFPKK